MTTPRTPVPSQPPKPVMDEWGVYDPQQAGLSALFARLDTPAPKTPDASSKPAKETQEKQ